jgi:nucleoside-diphosphate-sugar epimerase
MKILILGSSGQIGSALTEFCKNKGFNVEEFDIVNTPNEDLRFEKNRLLYEKMESSDFVFFLAFDVGGSRYLKNYQHEYQFLSNNTRLMERTFELLRQLEKPFIFASSQMSNMSFSPYGLLKALGEAYTRSLNGVIVKFWNVYGVERDLNKSHVITDFIYQARNNKVIKMLTNGQEQRQFLHADDCSQCLLSLALSFNQINKAEELHITSFEWNSILKVAEVVSRLYPGTSIVPAVISDDVQKNIINEPNKNILKYWTPLINLDEGIAKVNSKL